MKVLIKVQPLGLYNGQTVNAKRGEVVDLPDELADGLVLGGLAEPVEDEPPTEPGPTESEPPVVETAAVTATGAETATTTETTGETAAAVEPKAEKRTGRGARGANGG